MQLFSTNDKDEQRHRPEALSADQPQRKQNKQVRARQMRVWMTVLLALAVAFPMWTNAPQRSIHAQEEETVVYEDDLNSYASRGAMPSSSSLPAWWLFGQPANTAISLESRGTPGDKVLRIADSGTGTAFAQLHFPAISSGIATIEFDIRTEPDADPAYKHDFFGATLYSSQNEVLTQLQNSTQASGYGFKLLQKNASGHAYSTSLLPATAYTDGDWYRIRLIVDWSQKQVKAECYDSTGTTLLGSVDYGGFQIPEATDAAAIKFVTTSSGRGVLSADNLRVTHLPGESSGPPLQLLTVDASAVKSSVYANAVGVVSNHLFDSDLFHPNRANSFAESLLELGAGTVRFGEGEASDRYLWTSAPYPVSPSESLTPRLSYDYGSARPLSNSERALISLDGAYEQTQDFKEFMEAVSPLGIEPFVIVGIDAIQATNASWTTTREQLKTNAVEWVRYANVTNNWNVKYWEIGNEPFFTSQSGHIWTPQDYADVFLEFAAAMKAVDPTIHVGVPVHDSVSWNSAVLPLVSGAADFVALHLYGTTNTAPLETLVQHIQQYCALEDRDRLRIAITETNTYSAGNPFPNDMGRAAMMAAKTGKLLEVDQVDYMHFWVTRKGLNNQPNDERSALNEDGELLAMGKALQLWNRFLLDQMVTVIGATHIQAFATRSPASGELNVVLVNTSGSELSAEVTLDPHPGAVVHERWVLSGTGAADPDPSLVQKTAAPYANGTASLELEPYSVTVLAFKPAP